MKWLIMALALIGAVVAENTIPALPFALWTRWPITLCVILYYAISQSLSTALFAGILGGLATDAIAGLPTGCTPLVFNILAVLVSRYRDFIFIRQWVTHMAIGAVAASGMVLLTYTLLSTQSELTHDLPMLSILLRVIGSGLAGMLLMPLIFRGLTAAEEMMSRREGRHSEA